MPSILHQINEQRIRTWHNIRLWRLVLLLQVPVKDLTVDDCPTSAKDFYENIPIVYTWVDGKMPSKPGRLHKIERLRCYDARGKPSPLI